MLVEKSLRMSYRKVSYIKLVKKSLNMSYKGKFQYVGEEITGHVIQR